MLSRSRLKLSWNQCDIICRNALSRVSKDLNPVLGIPMDDDAMMLKQVALGEFPTMRVEEAFPETGQTTILCMGSVYDEYFMQDAQDVTDGVDEYELVCMIGPRDTPGNVKLGYVMDSGMEVVFPWRK